MSHLLATPRGITLAGVILAKRNSNGSFAIKGHQKYIHAQLQAAYGKAVTPQAMRYVVRGCELLAKVSDKELEEAAYPFHPNPHAKTTSGNDFSDLTKGLMMFALTGLNDMENIAQGKARLLKIQASIHHDSLLKSYGLPTWAELTKDDGDDEDEDEDDEDDDSDNSDNSGTSAGGGNSHYNPDEPRIPAGQPGGGQWTTAGNGTSTDSGSISTDDIRTALREEFDNYDPSALPQGTQVADNNLVQSDANNLAAATAGSMASDAQQSVTNVDGPYVNSNYTVDGVVGDGQCVALVKEVAGLPSTRNWVEGEEITGPNQPALATGTAIATFDEDGNYPQGNVPKHAAIFVSYTDNGIIVYDQWAGQPPHIRTITFDNAKLPQNNAYSYSVIMTKK